MNILAKEFDMKSLLKYVLPTILMMVFMSTYTIIDGLFVANLVGEEALSAVNVVLPVINVLLAIGLMFSTGGIAVMGKLMGEGKEKEARSFLSILYIVAIILGGILSAVFVIFVDEIVGFLGSSEVLYILAKDYLIVTAFFSIAFFLQVFVQSFFVLAGKPILGFVICLIGGLTNIALDYIFISSNMCDLGIRGAAYATGIANVVPGLFGLIYFLGNRKGVLYFEKPVFKKKILLTSMLNGSSELVSQLSTAVTTLLFNIILLDLVGEMGVASISVILYLQMFQTAINLGYNIGVAPIISYKYGSKDMLGLKNILKSSFKVIAIVSVVVIATSIIFSDFAVSIFIEKTSQTFEMAEKGLKIFSMAYIFMGINMFASSMFTALSNGRVSAILSLLRTMVFLIGGLLILPKIIGINGVWLAVPIAETLTFIISIYYYKKYKKIYGY